MAVGSFSVAEATKYTMVLPPSIEIPCPPRFTFGTPPASVMSAYYRATHLHGAGVYGAAGLAWCNGFVLDSSGSLLIGGDIQIHPHTVQQLTELEYTSLARAPAHRVTGMAAALVPPGNAHRIYGHWLVDILPKLAVLDAAGHDLEALCYPVPADTPAFARELMALFGVSPDRVILVPNGHRFVADQLLMPTSLHNGVRVSPLMRNAVLLFKRHLDATGRWRAPDTKETRIFLARRGRNRAMTNRGHIETMARQAGFTIVYPEERSLLAQFTLFAGAREILGEYGSAFHTAMLSPPGTVLAGFRGDQFHPAFIQSGLGTVLDQPTGYVFGTGDGQDYAFTVAEDAVRDCLDSVFHTPHGLASRLPLAKEPEPAQVLTPALSVDPRLPAQDTNRASGPGAFLRRLFARRAVGTIPVQPVHAPNVSHLTVSVLAHLQSRGDTEADTNGWAGIPGSGLTIEGVAIAIEPSHLASGLSYQTVRADKTLSERVRGGEYCGTRGQNTPIYGLAVYTGDAIPMGYSVDVECCFLDGSRCGPVQAGMVCCSKTLSPLVAVRIAIASDSRAPGLHTLLRQSIPT